ncbi:MAG: class II aldolase/adducin family protein [Candidatus Marinimicrobia bacterium]|nr:class II aldolase/adducin family protein [Candidatus Neomarinimicrobiota bacterium]MCF7830359.1 class II aldolase/adducin family protein [Candidatus Neomarinimicrobiota bacterium]MCF7882455.1 class II aldolase/adducin family protein [Candidatus Neomarinimicrobiota bacterium]
MSREDEYQIVETCRRLSSIGMMPASDGNVSLRLDEKTVIITPTGIRKEQLKPQDLVHIQPEDDDVSDRASSEWRMHAEIYRKFPDVNAVVHAHPVHLTAWGLRDELPDISLLYETAETIGNIIMIPAEEPGSAEYAKLVADALADASVGIMKRHGAVAVGESIEEALFRLERAEHLAHVESLTR